jgi:glycosyltransferase involved in cell wall biosynthesis
MKVLFYVNYPLAWAYGGHAIQIHETKLALERLGIQIIWLHHEAEDLPLGDIIHYWGKPPSDFHWQLAKGKGMRIVVSDMNPSATQRSIVNRMVRRYLHPLLKRAIGNGLYSMLGLEVFWNCNALICLNDAEKNYYTTVYKVNQNNIYVIPNGVDETFLQTEPVEEKQDKLLYIATIRRIKNQVAVASAAKAAKVPVEFIGDVLPTDIDYAEDFKRLLDDEYVSWRGPVWNRQELASIMKGSLGVFLASDYESQPLVLLEALACGIPVMAPDILDLRSYYGDVIRYSSSPYSKKFPYELNQFYNDCKKGLRQSFQSIGWSEVAEQINHVYCRVLDN